MDAPLCGSPRASKRPLVITNLEPTQAPASICLLSPLPPESVFFSSHLGTLHPRGVILKCCLGGMLSQHLQPDVITMSAAMLTCVEDAGFHELLTMVEKLSRSAESHRSAEEEALWCVAS